MDMNCLQDLNEENFDPNELFLDIIDDREEFSSIMQIIMRLGFELPNPHDRIRIFEWCKKLAELGGAPNQYKIRNEYAQYMSVMLRTNPVRFFQPFKQFPPEGRVLPLSVYVGNMIAECSGQPRAGAMQPVIIHQTDDCKAFLTVKKCPDGGLYCYMSVTPENFH